jgi:methionyl-tRNA formyltransferase
MKIVFMGSSDFGIPALKSLISEKYEIAGIVTTPARQKGRGLKVEESPVTVFAEQNGLKPVFKPENLRDNDFVRELSALHADLYVVIAFRILPPEVFDLPPLGTINVHASLLPKYRGPAPIHRAIEAGEKETGVTVFRIDKGVDTGSVILQKTLFIGDQETTPELYDRLKELGAETLVEACRILQKGDVQYLEQDHTEASHAPKLLKEESLIDWKRPATDIYNRIRAFKPFPGTYTLLKGIRMGIEWATPLEGSSASERGVVCEVSSDWFEVQCDNSRLRILEVKPAGKKRMPVKAFLLGTKVEKGIRLG